MQRKVARKHVPGFQNCIDPFLRGEPANEKSVAAATIPRARVLDGEIRFYGDLLRRQPSFNKPSPCELRQGNVAIHGACPCTCPPVSADHSRSYGAGRIAVAVTAAYGPGPHYHASQTILADLPLAHEQCTCAQYAVIV